MICNGPPLGDGLADSLLDGETLALGLMLALDELDGLTDDDGETLGETLGLTLGLTDDDGLTDADGLTEGLTDAEGLTDGLTEGLTLLEPAAGSIETPPIHQELFANVHDVVTVAAPASVVAAP